MADKPKRKNVRKDYIRKYWKEEGVTANLGKLSEYTVESISDDGVDDTICWCCGKLSYQERCHIIPHSLGGTDAYSNFFLLCGECHKSSPDTTDRDYFFKFVRDNSGRHADQMRSIVMSACSRINKRYEEGEISKEDVVIMTDKFREAPRRPPLQYSDTWK